MDTKVCKFGGTSLSSATNIAKVRDIVFGDETRRFVVVSAPGKRFSEDIKITDMLYKCAELARNEGTCAKLFAVIRERFSEIVTNLKIDIDINSILDETEKAIDKNKSDDFAASRGEYLSARIIAKYFNFEFIDAEQFIKFDSNGRFDADYTNDLIEKRLANVEKAVIPGFYGSMPGDVIKTFSRGGSDISGSIVAKGVKAKIYENWTDVNGFYSADPRIVQNPLQIFCLGYHELRELSYMGASVLHAEAIFPVRDARIPILIKNTFAPEKEGTMIIPDEDYQGNGQTVTGIAGKKDFTVITVEKSNMNAEIGFARKILSVLERYGISLEHMPSSIDTLSVVVNSNSLTGDLKDKVILRIREAVDPDKVTVIDDVALIATVGHGMCKVKGTAGRLFSAISRGNVNILMIDQGSSEKNIIVAVRNADYAKTIKSIYLEFLAHHELRFASDQM
ncbi:MAG: aspartate kinase [Clostridia bacterium]